MKLEMKLDLLSTALSSKLDESGENKVSLLEHLDNSRQKNMQKQYNKRSQSLADILEEKKDIRQ